jgi:hypothetical protein
MEQPMTKLTRDELIAKYGMNNPPDPNNPTAQALLDGRRLVADMFNWHDDIHQLFDPTRCPEMYAKAQTAHQELRAAMAAGDVEYVDASSRPYNPDDVDDTAMLVNFVGDPSIVVVRPDSVGMFAMMYKATWQASVRRADPSRCTVRLAPKCRATTNGRCEFWPYLCGQFLFMFAICPACRDRAIAIADDGQKLAAMVAHERLPEQRDPAWARTAPRWRRWWAALRFTPLPRWLVPLICGVVLVGTAAGNAHADPPGQNPHMPNVTIGYCVGGQGGFMATKWCDGQPYPDGTYWHQLIMTGSSFVGPVFQLNCVVMGDGPIPTPAPSGGCAGGV